MLEILAPAGERECLIAAINTGANAVYLGETHFSARKKAANFNDEQLAEAVRLCHLSSVKVYLALNTLMYDSEVPLMKEVIKRAAEISVDAIIVQDMGVVSLIKQLVPDMPLHGSTQMTISSVSGAKLLKTLGFKRVVLARELSLKEIENIVKAVDIETEVFVHGALCVSLSGQCYMSAFLGGRSGNRGQCAGPCRLNFSTAADEHVLSLKDLSIVQYLDELQAIGVTSAKIEGRLKAPTYVAGTVDACQQKLKGNTPNYKLLQDVFSRNGFTDGYFKATYKDMRGVRTTEDKNYSLLAVKEVTGLYKNVYKRYTVDFDIQIAENAEICCKASSSGHNITVYENIPSIAINRATTGEEVINQLKKLGGTLFEAGTVVCTIADNLAVKSKELNSIRRKSIDTLQTKIVEENTPHYVVNYGE